eukprot:8369223-Alexandrium_andersonii.AAC.1
MAPMQVVGGLPSTYGDWEFVQDQHQEQYRDDVVHGAPNPAMRASYTGDVTPQNDEPESDDDEAEDNGELDDVD